MLIYLITLNTSNVPDARLSSENIELKNTVYMINESV